MNQKTTCNDFQVISNLGRGIYSIVDLVSHQGKLYAFKKLSKKRLIKDQYQFQPFVQKQLLRRMDHPGIIKIEKCFQDLNSLYLLLEYCHGGSFINFIKWPPLILTSQIKRFYVAELLCILQYLHDAGISHGDLQPDNLMLSKEGHLKLIDFGTSTISQCKIIDDAFKQKIKNIQKQPNHKNLCKPWKGKTIVPQSLFLPPQFLDYGIYSTSSDLWALGCIIYYLQYGKSPFTTDPKGGSPQIKTVNIDFPISSEITDETIDLIKKLIIKNPEQRLGCGSGQGLMFDDLKQHPYFTGINFDNIFQGQIPEIVFDDEKNDQKLFQPAESIWKNYKNNLKDEKIMMHGIVQKRSGLSSTTSYLIVCQSFMIFEIQHYQWKPVKVGKMDNGEITETIGNQKFKIILNETIVTIKTDKVKQWIQIINESYSTLAKQSQLR